MAEKIVEFDKWCKECKWEPTQENEEPCETCLTHPSNEDSRKPIKWEEKEDS